MGNSTKLSLFEFLNSQDYGHFFHLSGESNDKEITYLLAVQTFQTVSSTTLQSSSALNLVSGNVSYSETADKYCYNSNESVSHRWVSSDRTSTRAFLSGRHGSTFFYFGFSWWFPIRRLRRTAGTVSLRMIGRRVGPSILSFTLITAIFLQSYREQLYWP